MAKEIPVLVAEYFDDTLQCSYENAHTGDRSNIFYRLWTGLLGLLRWDLIAERWNRYIFTYFTSDDAAGKACRKLLSSSFFMARIAAVIPHGNHEAIIMDYSFTGFRLDALSPRSSRNKWTHSYSTRLQNKPHHIIYHHIAVQIGHTASVHQLKTRTGNGTFALQGITPSPARVINTKGNLKNVLQRRIIQSCRASHPATSSQTQSRTTTKSRSSPVEGRQTHSGTAGKEQILQCSGPPTCPSPKIHKL